MLPVRQIFFYIHFENYLSPVLYWLFNKLSYFERCLGTSYPITYVAYYGPFRIS